MSMFLFCFVLFFYSSPPSRLQPFSLSPFAHASIPNHFLFSSFLSFLPCVGFLSFPCFPFDFRTCTSSFDSLSKYVPVILLRNSFGGYECRGRRRLCCMPSFFILSSSISFFDRFQLFFLSFSVVLPARSLFWYLFVTMLLSHLPDFCRTVTVTYHA